MTDRLQPCPKCNAQLELSEELVGCLLECPACGTQFSIEPSVTYEQPPIKKIDDFDAYLIFNKRANKMKWDLEAYIEMNYEEMHLEKRQRFVLTRFEAWLKQNEEAERFEDYSGIEYSSAVETIFGILAKRKMFAEGEAYTNRLAKLKWNDATGDWKKAVAEAECESEEEEMPGEISREEWRRMAQSKLQKLSDAKHAMLIGGLVNEAIGLKEPDIAQLALNALLAIKGAGGVIFETDDGVFLLMSDIALIRKDYDIAITHIQKAYAIVSVQCANKTQMKKIYAKAKNILRVQGVKKPTEEQISELLSGKPPPRKASPYTRQPREGSVEIAMRYYFTKSSKCFQPNLVFEDTNHE